MALLEIRKYGDPILRQNTSAVEKVDRQIQVLIDDMAETMYANCGAGLAAPQVGVDKRVIVVNAGEQFLALVNPKLIEVQGEQVDEEGCLSLPEIVVEVKRAARVVVEGLSSRGKIIKVGGEGLVARALQHEIDHLDGILMIDRISAVERVLISGKLRKLAQIQKEMSFFD